MDFLDELAAGTLCGDGAMGTMLLDAGIPLDQCFEELCVSQPDRIGTIHREYIAAGARLIQTNTFGANAVRLARFGMENRVVEINRAAATVARRAVGGGPIYVAGSVGPLGIDASAAAARAINRAECFAEQARALLEGEVDVLFLETFTTAEEMEVAYRAVEQISSAPTICSFACLPEGRLQCGTDLTDAFARLEEIGAKIFGLNCMNDPAAMLRLIRRLPSEYRLAAYPTAGFPVSEGGRSKYPVSPAEFARAVPGLVAERVRLIGGCCGTGPAHIAATASAIARCE